ncbi:MAG: type IX secretion system outer membrane channel protein PorV [Chitinophagales bacterium]|nr:type IX secretion system outer membrane channel protein PorV [Chitinophagales bacterium]
MNWYSRKAWCTLFAFSSITASQVANAQVQVSNGYDPNKVNTITTAVPFLRISTDTRQGGMGDVGIAMAADAGGAQANAAKMAFIDKDFGFSVSFTPWLKSLVDDIYLANISGYGKIKDKQTIQASLRLFSLGSINFRDENNNDLGTRKPFEMAIDAGYSRKFGEIFSLGVTLRFIYSNLASGLTSNGEVIQTGIAGAGDISWLVHKTFAGKGKVSHELYAGMNLSNLGSKITYTASTTKDFIPANMGIGLGYVFNANEKHQLGFYFDLNRLLVPTPVPKDVYYDATTKKIKAEYDKNANGVLDYKEASSVQGIFRSFGYAPGGSAEKFNENMYSIGLEYMYKKMFGVRAGYYYEHPSKGARQFLTVGATVKYSVASLHLSYLVPTTSLRNPLDNTFRFTLNFEFAKGGKKKTGEGISTTSEPLPTELKPAKKKSQELIPSTDEIKKE